MTCITAKQFMPFLVLLFGFCASTVIAATEDLGKGFLHHGVATPVSNHRGIVATVDGNGRDVVLAWLFDHRGGYALLMIDAETGRSEEFPMPFPPGGDCPYASILSSNNKFYTHFNSHFVEFDPVKHAFTFCHKTAPRMAMSMTEDDRGEIWSVTYPQSGVVSFNPETREFKDYGHVYKQNWAQYPRSIAADDTGWIYFGIGYTASQIIAFDPKTGRATPIVPEMDRAKGGASVYRDVNGKVYGHNPGGQWYELYKGKARKLVSAPSIKEKPIITGSQGLFHSIFPSGKKIERCDLVDHVLVVEDPKTGTSKSVKFDYTSEGAIVMGLAAAPNGTICGGTTFPMRFFQYDPKTDKWTNHACYGQWNTVARQGSHFFVGGYTHGFLLDWDPSKPWVPTVHGGTHPETIGWGYTAPEYYHFKGKIDEVRIWDRALTVEELEDRSKSGAVAWWSFDEGEGTVAADSSGNGNHAVIHGATWAKGKYGAALEFNGKDQYLEIPDSPSLHIRKALTIEAWVYPTPPHQGGYGGIINNIVGQANSRLLIENDGQTLAQVFINGSKQDVPGPRVRNNAWNHVAYIYDGTHEYWVVNGVPGKKFPRTGDLYVESNPKFLTEAAPDINRPHDLLAHPDGRTLVLAGTPGYGYTGGGLLFWDRKTSKRTLLRHTDLIPEHSTMSLVALPDGNILGGTTTSPGTGGEKKAKEAQLYILDLATKKLLWHKVLFPGAQSYHDLCMGPRGLVYGFVDRKVFFVFDPDKRKVIYQKNTDEEFGPTNSQQGPRTFVKTPSGDVYVLFVKGIATVDPETFTIKMIAKSPVPIGAGGDYLDGRIYFASGSHVYSYQLPE